MKKLRIVFNFEKEIFYLFCFLNLTGYNVENNTDGMHPFRKFIRRELKNKIEISNYLTLKNHILKKHQGQFVQWLLQKKYNQRGLSKFYSKKEFSFFNGFDMHFREFIIKEKNKLSGLKFKNVYSIERKKQKKRIIAELNNLMRKLNLNFGLLHLNKIVIAPNLLDAYGYGYGPKVGKTSFIVYGPLRDKNLRLITHEFLHSVVNSIISNNKKFLQRIRRFNNNKLDKKHKDVAYSDWPVFIEEYLVRAIDIKMSNLRFSDKEEILKEEEKKGFKNIKKMQLLLKKRYKENELLDILGDIFNNIEEYVYNQ